VVVVLPVVVVDRAPPQAVVVLRSAERCFD